MGSMIVAYNNHIIGKLRLPVISVREGWDGSRDGRQGSCPATGTAAATGTAEAGRSLGERAALFPGIPSDRSEICVAELG